ncbi:MAG: two-component system sensor histidine kinase NtrB [Acidobacteriota bacterium]
MTKEPTSMEDSKQRMLILIVARLLLVTVALETAFFATSPQLLASELRHYFVLFVCLLSLIYLLLWKYSRETRVLYYLQFYVDLLLVSTFIYVSGGIGSPFVPLYLLIIVYASLLQQRQGGIHALILSSISYIATSHLVYLGAPDSTGAYWQEIYRLALDTLGFVAVALLGIYLSERLHSTRRELGAARMLHENIVNSIRGGLMTLDLEGRITSLNQAAEEICGCTEEQLLLKPLSVIFPESVLQQILESNFRLTSRALRIEFWMTKRREDALFLGMSCSPLLSQEKETIGYVLSFQDLTDIQKREEEVKFKEKMAAIGQMSADMAHEIRNPLGSLYGSIQVLQSELRLSDEKARLVDIVLRECERLNNIVGDFLAYAGPQASSPQYVDIVPLVRETAEIFKNNPDWKEGHLFQISSCAEALECMADPDQLKQVIWNILQNAARAMPNGGKLSINLTNGDSRVLLSFKDQGIGMKTEQKKRLFQPFHSGFKKGSGLGMAIVYQIVQQHHGLIDVRSRPGEGTEIVISLPAR